MNYNDIIEKSIRDIENIEFNDMPSLDLYMDQVTTYLNEKFEITKRYDDDKLLTKTMINNYAKSHLLPPPEKKKYNNEHIITLSLIYFFKNVLSISDVSTLLKPLTDNHFKDDDVSMKDISHLLLDHTHNTENTNSILNEVKNELEYYDNLYDDNDYLKLFGIIFSLNYDVFIKKTIMEKLIDVIKQKNEEVDGKKKSDKKK